MKSLSKYKPLIVNFFAGPGAGKSTMAATVFSELKWKNRNVELVTEYAKDKTWEKSTEVLKNQFYVAAKQQHRIFRASKQVDAIITDSPLLLSLAYHKDYPNDNFTQFLREENQKYNNLNFLIKRIKPYNPIGRNQTEIEAKNLDDYIHKIMINEKLEYNWYETSRESCNEIIQMVDETIKLRNKIKIIVITGPSGAGKTSLANKLNERTNFCEKLKTTTTRKPRENENDSSYNFVDYIKFESLISEKCLIEYEEVYPQLYYGIQDDDLYSIQCKGKNPIIVTDYKGALKLKEMFGINVITIFLSADEETLLNRIKERDKIEESELLYRKIRFKTELEQSRKFDIIIDTNNIDEEGVYINTIFEISKKLR